MTSNGRAHLVCEQLLNILKTSKLNYLVKETPYSAFVTIRKKFIKDQEDNSIVTLVHEENPSLKTENFILKQRCKALECEIGYLKADKEDLKLTSEKLSNENDSHNGKINELNVKLDSVERLLNDSQEKVKDQIELLDEMETKKDFLNVLLSKAKVKVNEMEKVKKENDDNIKMLEEIVKNKNFELERFNKELDSSKPFKNADLIPILHSCDQCDFTTENEKGMKIHMGRMHEVTCTSCAEKFAGENKLKTHMCKIYIENPNSEQLYMKNWVLKDSCIRVFGHKEKKEVALLHCRHCTHTSYCSDYPPGLKNRIRQDDENGLIHLDACLYLKSTKVDWGFIVNHVYESGPDDL